MKFLKSRVFIAALCILLAGVVAFGLLPMQFRDMSATTYVITAAQNIAEGTVLTEELLVSIEVGAYGLSPDVITSKDEVVGKVANATLFKGEYILSQRLITEEEYNAKNEESAIELKPNEMLIAIQLPSTASGLAGLLRAGDLVSIYELIEPTDAEIEEAELNGYMAPQSKAKKIFDALRVYEVRNSALQSVDDLDKAVEVAKENGQETSYDFTPTYVIFCCTEKQAAEMIRLVSEGILYMTLNQPEVK